MSKCDAEAAAHTESPSILHLRRIFVKRTTENEANKKEKRKLVLCVTSGLCLVAFAPLNSPTGGTHSASPSANDKSYVFSDEEKKYFLVVDDGKNSVFNERNFLISFRRQAHATFKHLDSLHRKCSGRTKQGIWRVLFTSLR